MARAQRVPVNGATPGEWSPVLFPRAQLHSTLNNNMLYLLLGSEVPWRQLDLVSQGLFQPNCSIVFLLLRRILISASTCCCQQNLNKGVSDCLKWINFKGKEK